MTVLTRGLNRGSNGESNGPVRGSLGNQSGYGALQALEMMRASGTLLLEQFTSDTPHDTRYWLGLWDSGQHRSFALGETLELSASDLSFTFYAHRVETSTLPQFGSHFPRSNSAVLRALPALGSQRLSLHDTDLRALVARLTQERFTGTLAVRTQEQERQEGVMLFFSGRIGAAFHEVYNDAEGKRNGNRNLLGEWCAEGDAAAL